MLQKSYLYLSFFLSVIFFQVHGAHNPIIQEITDIYHNNQDISFRMNMNDGHMTRVLDFIEKSKVIAEQDSFLKKIANGLLLYVFPGLTLSGLVYINPEQAPLLYTLAQEVAEKHNIPTPPIFFTLDETPFKGLFEQADDRSFGIFAVSFVPTASMLVINKKLTEVLNDNELKTVLAHEFAHIKGNHSFKRATMVFAYVLLSAMVFKYLIWNSLNSDPEIKVFDQNQNAVALQVLNVGGTNYFNLFAGMIGLVSLYMVMCYGSEWIQCEQESSADKEAIMLTDDVESFTRVMNKLENQLEFENQKLTQLKMFIDKKVEQLKDTSPTVAGLVDAYARFITNMRLASLQKASNSAVGTPLAPKKRIAQITAPSMQEQVVSDTIKK